MGEAMPRPDNSWCDEEAICDLDRTRCQFLSPQAWAVVGRALSLSDRELQITRCIFADCKENVIAQHLGVSPHTIHTHGERLYRKLGVTSRVDLVVRVVDVFLHLTAHSENELPPICPNRSAGKCPLDS
jgi:DNA-binding CsgD family transcriptional regulator